MRRLRHVPAIVVFRSMSRFVLLGETDGLLAGRFMLALRQAKVGFSVTDLDQKGPRPRDFRLHRQRTAERLAPISSDGSRPPAIL